MPVKCMSLRGCFASIRGSVDMAFVKLLFYLPAPAMFAFYVPSQ